MKEKAHPAQKRHLVTDLTPSKTPAHHLLIPLVSREFSFSCTATAAFEHAAFKDVFWKKKEPLQSSWTHVQGSGSALQQVLYQTFLLCSQTKPLLPWHRFQGEVIPFFRHSVT